MPLREIENAGGSKHVLFPIHVFCFQEGYVTGRVQSLIIGAAAECSSSKVD